jgi:hypothetical protein
MCPNDLALESGIRESNAIHALVQRIAGNNNGVDLNGVTPHAHQP